MREILLTRGKVALVDDADFESVNAFNWCADMRGRRFYAARKIKKDDGSKTTLYMHQFLMPGVSETDHKDGDGLNNQRANLRPATRTQNSQGFKRKRVGASSCYRGVVCLGSRWWARIVVTGKRINLGCFASELEAAQAYDAAARKYFGDFAAPNFNPSNEPHPK